MRVIIKYEFDPNYYPSYFAKAWVENKVFCKSAETFELAREKLIYTLQRIQLTASITRDPEEVEI